MESATHLKLAIKSKCKERKFEFHSAVYYFTGLTLLEMEFQTFLTRNVM